MEGQDLNIFNLIVKNKKGVVIVVNKCDLVEKNKNTTVEYANAVKELIAPFQDVPIVFASALTNQRIHKVLETVTQVYENRKQKIATSKLNEFLQTALEIHSHRVQGKSIKNKYVTSCQLKRLLWHSSDLPQYIRDP
jgi:GTP-binding protein